MYQNKVDVTEEELASPLAEEGKGGELEWGNILEKGILCALQTNSNLKFFNLSWFSGLSTQMELFIFVRGSRQ
jgi:hypothetical protein